MVTGRWTKTTLLVLGLLSARFVVHAILRRYSKAPVLLAPVFVATTRITCCHAAGDLEGDIFELLAPGRHRGPPASPRVFRVIPHLESTLVR